jgi:PTS system mannose-specific IIA component
MRAVSNTVLDSRLRGNDRTDGTMIGVVIVAHGSLPEAFIHTATLIGGAELKAVTGVAVTGQENPEQLRGLLSAAIKKVNAGAGVAVFTDMFGGTPSNIALSFLKDNEVEVVSGLNLPMLVDMLYLREGKSLKEFCSQLAEIGRGSIRLASQYLQNA